MANGVDVNDFEGVVERTAHWREWGPAWKELADVHAGLAGRAQSAGHVVSATRAWQRTAWCRHVGKFLWFEDSALHGELRDGSVAAYRQALPHLDPPARRLDLPFEGNLLPAHLRVPAAAGRPPVVLVIPGLDSSKEEFFQLEQEFLARGLATLTLDGPGQSESSARWPMRADWGPVLTTVLDNLQREHSHELDLTRVGAMGTSFGGLYAIWGAAEEPRVRAVVELAGPYSLAECWAHLNPLTKAGFTRYSWSENEAVAEQRATAFSLEGVLSRVSQPVLVVHGARDSLFPLEQAERIAQGLPQGRLVAYPDGNHVCNNIPYKYRPLVADWLADGLS